jgi:hypothetical protein
MAKELDRALSDDLDSAGAPEVEPYPLSVERQAVQLFKYAESILVHVVSLILVLLVLVALVGVVVSVRGPLFHEHDFSAAVVDGVNSVFLAVILLELLHTTLSRGPISRQLQEFLIIGVTAGVRHGLALAVESQQGGARDAVINLAINSVAVLGLVLALWLVRAHALGAGSGPEPDDE